MIAPSSLPERKQLALKAFCVSRLEALRAYRISWWAHWAALAEMFLPRRYRWFVTPNRYNRGSPLNQAIVDETGLLAARVLATGLLSGLTSPTKPWFSLALAGDNSAPEGPVQEWLAECTSRMLTVLAGSNFYQALGTVYHDLVVFGSAALITYADTENVVHFCVPALGEFMFGLNAKLQVDTLYREYTYTVKETVDEFGLANVSESTRNSYRTGGTNLDTEVVICHAIEPNSDIYQAGEAFGKAVPASFKFREVYWEQTSSGATQRTTWLLRIGGFKEKPFNGFRWDVTSNDPYGRSPAWTPCPPCANSRSSSAARRRRSTRWCGPQWWPPSP